MSEYDDLKYRTWQANKKLVASGVVWMTFGNASAIDRSRGVIAIKPSGVDYSELTPEHIVVVDLENKPVEGTLRPSSDTETHVYLYNHFDTIGGVVHTHSLYATGWAQAQKPLPVLGTTHADYSPVDIPCTDVMDDESIRGRYEFETGKQIVGAFSTVSFEDTPMVLVGGHGPFTWGPTVEKAVENSVVLEMLAKMACVSYQVNSSVPRLKETLIMKHYDRKHGANAYYGQNFTSTQGKNHDTTQ